MTKKLNIAFVWHFHQPVYQEKFSEDFVMPWVRLHASKDYLDMLLRCREHKRIKLNFNISPVLLNSIQKYSDGMHDLHSRLLIAKEHKLSEMDKNFVLQYFFDVNYSTMIMRRSYYAELYNKRYSKDDISIADFTEQEFFDIIANYTLCWIDKKFYPNYPRLSELSEKQKNYTYDDRLEIFEIQYDIIKKIIPSYREFQQEGLIEISTSPYYHPIIPLLLDINESNCAYNENLPEKNRYLEQDAKEQTLRALDYFEEVFGKRPLGVWLPEHCISMASVNMLNELGVKWTITDEGILANTLGREFARDFEGNLEAPFDLCVHYGFNSKNNKVNVVFADSFFTNLVGFGYGNYDGKVAANDFYEKIKTVQSKLQFSPKQEHLLTIGMDGENCWESYQNDGNEFLDTLYELIGNDETLETVLLGDFIERIKPEKLDRIASGSWINRNFDLWIGEPTKNLAWIYLDKTRNDLARVSKELIQNAKDDKDIIEAKRKIDAAKEEVFVAEGSDWFWWYGEPNESSNDHIFDFLFRSHLKNVYTYLGQPTPKHLDVPLASIIGKPIRQPKGHITPIIDGISDPNLNSWTDAGYIFLPDSPSFSAKKTIKGIYYGSDDDNIYLKFELSKNNLANSLYFIKNQVYIYFIPENLDMASPVRIASRTENLYPILENSFGFELSFSFNEHEIIPPQLLKSTIGSMWQVQLIRKVSYAYKDSIEIALSFDDIGITKAGQRVEFCIITGSNGNINEVYPQDVLLNLTR
ncbi:MAG: hypothetical protein LUE64_02765 [Candidatus Gastranaerophilales bacterium]|nr:hypothetical protein [Candidatus Gastranaerophilales bacterium]